MNIETPGAEHAGDVADQWVSLAEEQRAFGSHLLAAPNRTRIRDAVVRHIVDDRLLVARENDELLGFVMVTVEDGGYDQDVTRGIVENIYVLPDERNRGVGSKLLATAESHLAQRGVDAVALEVMADNEDARRFYSDNGYRPHRIQMERSLRDETETE